MTTPDFGLFKQRSNRSGELCISTVLTIHINSKGPASTKETDPKLSAEADFGKPKLTS